MDIFFNRFPGGRDKALLFSFDDGRIEDRRLVSLMNRYGLKGTFHLNSGFLDKEKYLHQAEIRSLYSGHEIAGHTMNHVFLNQIPNGMKIKELKEDKETLEKLTGQIVRGLSWPYGSFSQEAKDIARLCGYEYSRTTVDTGRLEPPEDLLAWHPATHHSRMNDELWNRFLDDHRKDMRLMMIWGHSYEFDTEEKWKQFSSLLERMSGRHDVWYATCIQVAEYLKAVSSLVFSASMNKVYNPSAVAVWLEAEGQSVCVPGGQEITICEECTP